MKKLIALATATVVATSSPMLSTAASYKIVNKTLIDAETGKSPKGYVVYRGKLYKNGTLAKGFVAHKKKLYKDGKLYRDTMLYKGHFYILGELRPDDELNVYNNKLYQGPNLAKGYHKVSQVLYKNGIRYNGIYKDNYYIKGKASIDQSRSEAIVTQTKVNTAYVEASFDFGERPYTIKTKDIIVSDGAKVTDFKIIKNIPLIINSTYTVHFKLKNVKPNTAYTIHFSKINITNVGNVSHTSTFTSIDQKSFASANAKKIVTYYDHYMNMSNAKLQSLKLADVKPFAEFYVKKLGAIELKEDDNINALFAQLNYKLSETSQPYVNYLVSKGF